MSSIAFDGFPVKIERFPADKTARQLVWAQKFAGAYQARTGIRYTVEKCFDEPGDVLLKLPDQEDIYLQMTEAVDLRRVEVDRYRDWYTDSVLRVGGDALKRALSGVMVILNDGGQIARLPNPKSPQGQRAVEAIALYLIIAGGNFVSTLPSECGGSAEYPVPGTDVRFPIILARYAPISQGKSMKWLWHGHAWGIGDPTITPRVFETARKKLKHYGNIRNPFWLLIYTANCLYDAEQEKAIRDVINADEHRFAYIFFFDGSGIKQIFPFSDDPQDATGKTGWVLLPLDAVPRPGDERFIDVD